MKGTLFALRLFLEKTSKAKQLILNPCGTAHVDLAVYSSLGVLGMGPTSGQCEVETVSLSAQHPSRNKREKKKRGKKHYSLRDLFSKK